MSELATVLARAPIPPLLQESGLGWRAAEKGDRHLVYDSLRKSAQAPFVLGRYKPWVRHGLLVELWAKLCTSQRVQAAVEAEPAAFPGGHEVFGRVQAVLDDWKKLERAAVAREFNRFYGHVRALAFHSDDVLVVHDAERPETIIAWATPEYAYVKQLSRGHGLEEFLRRFWHGTDIV